MTRAPMAVVASVVLLAAGAGLAGADTSMVASQPNRDLALTVDAGCGTDRDNDRNFDTCTSGDTASLTFVVFNQSDVTQSVRLDYAFDGPGDEVDRSFTEVVEIAPDDNHFESDELRIRRSTPLGDYTLSVTASGSETAATSAGFSVHEKGT